MYLFKQRKKINDSKIFGGCWMNIDTKIFGALKTVLRNRFLLFTSRDICMQGKKKIKKNEWIKQMS